MGNPENNYKGDSHQTPDLGVSEVAPVSGDKFTADGIGIIDYGQVWHDEVEATNQPEQATAEPGGDYDPEEYLDYGFSDYSQLPAGPQAGHKTPDTHDPDA